MSEWESVVGICCEEHRILVRELHSYCLPGLSLLCTRFFMP